jgi:hypothetical protein
MTYTGNGNKQINPLTPTVYRQATESQLSYYTSYSRTTPATLVLHQLLTYYTSYSRTTPATLVLHQLLSYYTTYSRFPVSWACQWTLVENEC